MKGLVVDIARREGATVEKGDPIAVLSAMKMETIISAPFSGTISRIAVNVGDSIDQGDLVVCVA
jgi:pyruvate carboxylase